MKSIAYLMPVFPVFSETFVGTEIRAMQRQGHDIKLIAFERGAPPFQPKDNVLAAACEYIEDLDKNDALEGLKVPPSRWLRAWSFARQQKGIRPRSLMYAGARLAALLLREELDHIHAQFSQATAATAIVAARLAGITVSFVGHGSDVYRTPSDLPLKLRSADFSVAVCEDMRKDFHWLVPGSAVGLVHCGVETDDFELYPLTPRAGHKLLFVGRLIDCKGVDDVLKALATIPSEQRPELDVVGDGPLLEPLRALVRALDLTGHVRFLGRRDQRWLAVHSQDYVGFVGAFREGDDGSRDTGPVVVKEAMAMGLPVITTAFMGCKDMVSDECGFRVPPGDQQILALAMKTLAHLDDEPWLKMAKAARERVETLFHCDVQAQRLSHLIENIRPGQLAHDEQQAA